MGHPRKRNYDFINSLKSGKNQVPFLKNFHLMIHRKWMSSIRDQEKDRLTPVSSVLLFRLPIACIYLSTLMLPP